MLSLIPTQRGASIISIDSAISSKSINNKMISSLVNTSKEWIEQRTGIKNRTIVTGRHISIIDLSSKAALKALKQIKLKPIDIELIIFATSTPNDLFGSASKLQANIGAFKAVALDLTVACSGFIVAMIIATQFIENNSYRHVLIIGADVLSKWINWKNRNTCILFGDGAGAMIMSSATQSNRSILGFTMNTDGNQAHLLSIPYEFNYYSNSSLNIFSGQFDYIQMNGRNIYKFAISKIPASILSCLQSLKLNIKAIDWLLLHQANKRIILNIAEKLTLKKSNIITNIETLGNTSAASIPLALTDAINKNLLIKNQLIVISGFGAGLTWSTIIVKWQ
uniref:FabH n=1 Tax=Pterocladiophila hemisphaerica TaxID=2712948 RepID=A0A6M3WWB2_9FLOR|nr:FabH [Pterocladiophila hemisphaerica]